MRFLLFAVPFMIGASLQAPAEPPPAILRPNIHDGIFDPNDYHWLRGQFAGASAADKANYEEIDAWRIRCRAKDLAQVRADLADIGVSAGPSIRTIPYRSLLCNQAATEPEPLNLRDWNGFTRDVAYVRPIAQGFLAAVALAEKTAEPRSPALADQLVARSIGEQTLRRGMDWAIGSGSDGPSLSLSSQQRGILVSQIAIALAARDHANTEWLEGIVVAKGWPKRTEVGDAAEDVAWLLVQHADADPAFQARALKLMEPLAAIGEVNPKDYAYLYDRVMLKLVGKQRYATQLTCQAGHWRPQAIEDTQKVNMWRHQVGLSALDDDLRKVDRDMGLCADHPADG